MGGQSSGMNTLATQQHLNQILDNIEKDQRLTDPEKEQARQQAAAQRAALLATPYLPADIWNNHCTATHPNLSQLAFAHPRPMGARLGNIWAVHAFQSSVGRQLSCNEREAERIVGLCCKPNDELDEDQKEELEELYERLVLRDGGDCWLFDGLTSSIDPFDGIEPGGLSCRLGLPCRVGEKFVMFAVVPPDDARRPCVLDVGWFFHKFWRPGGRTRPFCSASTQHGLEEWIATPPVLQETGGPIAVHMVGEGTPDATQPYDVL